MKKLAVTFCMLAMLCAFSMPVFSETNIDDLAKRVEAIEKTAGAWSLYGSARTATFWNKYNEDAIKGMFGAPIYGEKDGLTHGLQADLRLGATVNHGDWGGLVEAYIGTGWKTNMFFGYKMFGPLQVLVGQTYSPTDTFISNQTWSNDVNFLFFAPAYTEPTGMIRLRYGGLKFAVVEPNMARRKADFKSFYLNAMLPNNDIEIKYPKIEASYHFAPINEFYVDVFGGYQTYGIVSQNLKYDVSSYLVGLTSGVCVGPAYLRGSVWTGQNTGYYGGYGVYTIGTHFGTDEIVIEDGKVKDASAFGAAVVAGVKASEIISFEAGIGYVSLRSDQKAAVQRDDNLGGYLQGVIKLGGGFSVIPEIGYFDYQKGLFGEGQGTSWYAGLQAKIDF